ncbi:MAG: SAM-dependent methyltransferase [Solirubrobacteraceae bacterium]
MDTRAASRRQFERVFEANEDPWGYRYAPTERARFDAALAVLDRVCPPDGFVSALEIGCAEGAFTELLVPRCQSLLAVDFSPLAVERARRRCARFSSLRFGSWDLRTDDGFETFELVVVMDVLDSLYRPQALRAARRRLVQLLAPGGQLLVTAKVQSPAIEEARWAKWLVRGGRNILRFLGRHPGLVVIEQRESGGGHLVAVFRRI